MRRVSSRLVGVACRYEAPFGALPLSHCRVLFRLRSRACARRRRLRRDVRDGGEHRRLIRRTEVADEGFAADDRSHIGLRRSTRRWSGSERAGSGMRPLFWSQIGGQGVSPASLTW